MTAEEQDIIISERESKVIDPSPLTDENGDIVNLSGSSFKWVCVNDGEIIITKTTDDGITITSESDGKWEIEINPSDTDGYGGIIGSHEGRLIDGQGRESVVTKGEFDIKSSDT